ncbi:MAG: DMT family transporter, partial [Leadbetterella sp.]
MKYIAFGILFAFFWASASSFAKLGIQYADPLVLFQIRFLVAGSLLFLYLAISKQLVIPSKKEFIRLSIFGFLNTTTYLVLFVLSVQFLAGGIGSMATSLCPIMIVILNAVFFKHKASLKQYLALIFGFLGVGLASWPLLEIKACQPIGLVLIFLSMLSYSVGTIFFNRQSWTLNRLQINSWQVLLGGIF